MPAPKAQSSTGTATHGAAITDVTGTAAATFGAAEQTLVNSMATKLNAALAAMRSANIVS